MGRITSHLPDRLNRLKEQVTGLPVTFPVRPGQQYCTIIPERYLETADTVIEFIGKDADYRPVRVTIHLDRPSTDPAAVVIEGLAATPQLSEPHAASLVPPQRSWGRHRPQSALDRDAAVAA